MDSILGEKCSHSNNSSKFGNDQGFWEEKKKSILTVLDYIIFTLKFSSL